MENLMKEQIHGGDVYRHPDVLDFSANMNPLGTPESVILAAQKGVRNICNYPDVQQHKLKTALADYENVPYGSLICGNGAAELIFTLAQALRPKRAVVLAPTFAEYELALKSVGCEMHHVMLFEEDGFELKSVQGVCDEVSAGADLVCLCNPNNPTGKLISRKMILYILNHCRKHHSRLLLDECFNDFIDDPDTYTLKHDLYEYPNLFLLKAFTKRYAMAGLRLGYGICSDVGLLDRMGRCVQPWNISIPAQEAGTAALMEKDYEKRARLLIRTEREWLKGELRNAGLTVYDSKANYIFFKGPEDLGRHCLENKVMIRDCSNYAGLAKGYYRIAVKRHEENEQLIRAIGR